MTSSAGNWVENGLPSTSLPSIEIVAVPGVTRTSTSIIVALGAAGTDGGSAGLASGGGAGWTGAGGTGVAGTVAAGGTDDTTCGIGSAREVIGPDSLVARAM